MVSDGPLIDLSVVLDGAQLIVLLFNEEEGSGIGAFRWSDVALALVLLYELLQGLLLCLCQHVYFSR